MKRSSVSFLPILVCWMSLYPASLGYAQNAAEVRDTKALELEQVQESLEAATKRQKALREEIALLDRDVGAINRALLAAAERGQQLEAGITATEERLGEHLKQETAIKTRLNARRGVLSEVLGALQRMGNNPPPALLVRPEDALASVRSAILLGAVVPGIRRETETILNDLNSLREVKLLVEQEKLVLAADLNALAEDESRLTLLVEEKNQLMGQSKDSLTKEREKSVELINRARSLEELIKSMESELASAAAAAEAARVADENRKKRELDRLKRARELLAKAGEQAGETGKNGQLLLKTNDSVRMEPAIAFSKAQASLPKPVVGTVIYGFGDKLGPQKRSSGMAFATRPNARVLAPADGWVVYAGVFRSFGKILILNAGEKYHLVMTGLSEVNVTPGRFVLAGEPVGRMGATKVASAVAIELGSNRPVLSVELRKDGKPIDPAPWWRRDDGQESISSAPGRVQKGSKNDS